MFQILWKEITKAHVTMYAICECTHPSLQFGVTPLQKGVEVSEGLS